MPRSALALACAGVALCATITSSAAGVMACRGCRVQHITLVESRATDDTAVPVRPGHKSGGDLFLWAGGVFAAPHGGFNGTVMGYGTFSSARPHAHFRGTDYFQFRDGSTLITKGYSTAVGADRRLPGSYRHRIIGGTGRFFAATGEEAGYRLAGGRYRHDLTVVLPPTRAEVVTLRHTVFLSLKATVDRSGPGTEDIGDQRVVVGDVRSTDDGPSTGVFYLRSYIEQIFDGGTHQWLAGPMSYRFIAGGTLVGAGAYQRVSGTVPTAYREPPFAITGGTGPYAGYHGELIPDDVAPGVTVHTIRLVREGGGSAN